MSQGHEHMRFLFLALDVDLDRQAADAIHVRELARNLAALGHVADVLAESGGKEIEASDRLRAGRTGAAGTRRHVIRALRIAQNVQPDAVYERGLTPQIGSAG